MKDLEYYGFENVNTDTIKEQSASLALYWAMADKMRKVEVVMDTRKDISMLAQYCFLRVQLSRELDFVVGRDYHEKGLFARPDHNFFL